ncbi:MAG: GNAT family N-acetyltransferase [Candidatus Thermoplasmatota archaeon]
MIIRVATENDFPVVAILVATIFSEDLRAITGRIVHPSLLLPYIKIYKPYIFIAEEENVVLGVIIISERKLLFPFPQILFYLKNFGIITSIKSYLRLIKFRKKMPKKLENEYFIEAIAVDESARDKGIGKELVASAEKILKEKNAKYFGLVVRAEKPAIEFYKALGFVKVKDCITKAFGKWYYMRKALTQA